MGIFDEDIKLPGVITQVEADYSYGFDQTSFGTTDSVVIIGTAFNGPVGVPTPVYSVEHAAYIFGSAYDNFTRLEASLVAGIQDAWDRGCRTLYAVRVGGKEMFKDFELCIDSKYKLRVSSLFPTNTGKECYFLYDGTVGAESITFYKPAERATIAEKRRGAVENANSVLKTTMKLSQDYGLTREDRLVDLIKVFNEHVYNNVLKLTIVDQDGVDVTTSPDVYGLAIGAIYPGAYFIGRKESACEERTELSFHITKESTALPYESIRETYFRRLDLNTDVSQPYPIYTNVSNSKIFHKALRDVQVVTTNWEFLETAKLASRAFVPDAQDYEESNLSNFEIYKRLGSGFAITARAERRPQEDGADATPRISETPTTDVNRVVPINDGIYSLLEDAEIKYRALVCASADEKITGKLPRAKDFRVTTPSQLSLLKGYIALTPKVKRDDFTAPKKYKVTIGEVKQTIPGEDAKIQTSAVLPIISAVTKEGVTDVEDDRAKAKERLQAEVREGKLEIGKHVLAGDKLYRVNSNGIQVLENDSYKDRCFIVNGEVFKGVEDTADGNKIKFEKGCAEKVAKVGEADATHILGSILDGVFLFKYDKDTFKVIPVGDFKSIYNPEKEEQALVAYAEALPFVENNIVLSSALFKNVTIQELADLINEHEVLGGLFTATVTKEGSEHKDELVSEAIKALEEANNEAVKADDAGTYKRLLDLENPATSAEDRVSGYDYSLYIPYRTNDNFVRQLAQHCAYTELKTTPTFGFIGCKRLVNTGLSNIASKVQELSTIDFDLYAKTNVGRNMLDRQNLPFQIGKNVSVVFGQYPVTMTNNSYRYVSNGAAGYAGMVSTLPLDQSSTGQPIDLPSLDFVCSKNQLEKLTAVGLVTFRRSFSKGLVVTDGVTMARADSVFRRLSASRITGAVEDLIRQASEPFIGKQNHAANRNALKTAITSALDKITGVLIEGYDFNINNDPSIMKYSYIEINYRVVPIYEIREIRNTIKVTDTLNSSSTTRK